MDEWSDGDAPAWRRVHGIGRPFQPSAAGRRGCMFLLGGALVLIVLVLLLVALA